jgi:hypothetical protein
MPEKKSGSTKEGSEKTPVNSFQKSEDLRVSEVVQKSLRLFETNDCEGTPYDVERALAALDRMSGCISHGSLAQNMDDELYGPTE